MTRKLFVNLPVADLTASIEFFTRLGFTFNAQFTDEHATCMVVSDEAFVMLLTRDFYATFTSKAVADATTHSEVIICVSATSRDEVDQLVEVALESGGRHAGDKVEDGPMYGWSFEDPDGHLWEVMHMADVSVPA